MNTLALVVSLALGAAAPTKVALVPISAGEGVNDKTAGSLTEAISNEVRRVPGVQLITQQEIGQLLGLQKSQALLGCAEDNCMAELGGALGVDRLVIGNLAKLGESWLFTLKMMDVKKAKVIAQTDRRLRKATIDDVLDQIKPMVGEVFGAQPVAGPITAQPAPQQPAPTPAPQADPKIEAPPAAAGKLGPPWGEEPFEPAPKTDDLKVATDGKGFYVAFPAAFESFTSRLFAGDGKLFFAQRVLGGASADGNYSFSFWEPRNENSRRGSLEYRGGVPKLECGKTVVELKELGAPEAKKMLSKARLLKPRWRRMGVAFARDDSGNYFYVDRAREPDDSKDFRLYLGTKGKMQGWQVTDYIADDAAEIFVIPGGRLKHPREKAHEAEWIPQSGQKVTISWLPIDSQVSLVYTDLGVYAGEKLGSACDGRF